MPGFITHYICGQAVLRSLTPEARALIEKHISIYNMGTQGPDIFFYYLPGLLRKRTRGIGVDLHRKKTGSFLRDLMDIMARTEKKKERDILLAYTAGYLTHYALDSGAHPYVYARTRPAVESVRSRVITQRVQHRKMETAIDVLMLKLTSSEKPADYHLWQLIKADAAHTRTAAAAVSTAIRSAYAREIDTRDVYKAMVYMVQLTRLLQSRGGRRKHLMERLENLTIGEPLVSSLIHLQEVKDGVDYLNMEKSLWSPQEKRNDSFVDLYHQAVADAAGMVTLLYAYQRGDATQSDLWARVGSRSLATGAEVI